MAQRPRFLYWRWIAVFSGVLLIVTGVIFGIAQPQRQDSGFIEVGATLLMFGLISVVANKG